MKENFNEILKTKPKNIIELIGKMETLQEYFKNNKKYKPLRPFLKTYTLVTKEVAKKQIQNKGFFEEDKQLEKLDLEFANLYLEPLKEYLINKKKKQPWNSYLKYCEKEDSKAFLQMFIGIHIHINADLCFALSNTSYKNKKDFLAINTILEELIPKVMWDLTINHRDFLGFGALIFSELSKKEFKKIIIKWREQAWKNSRKKINKKKLYEECDKTTKKIIKIFEEIFELKNPFSFLKELEKLKINY